ncbi:Flp family type IVb pilin [Methyloterricola oryzae]|uniref:Flp family type IVb pilin n=1 Tax=Methyloterricola oryzae TaxID=1495050 RepID=UPI0005EB2E9F|nr:hypothetical protein [Methyloterricola oryzae]
MNTLTEKLKGFWKEEEGLEMVEYAVTGGLILLGAVAAFLLVGGDVNRIITAVHTELGTVGGGAGGG